MLNPARKTKTIRAELSVDDLANLVAIGNRSNMSGLEADTWVELKSRLVGFMRQAEDSDDLEGIDVSPGGTA